jgi:hypothetical protein
MFGLGEMVCYSGPALHQGIEASRHVTENAYQHMKKCLGRLRGQIQASNRATLKKIISRIAVYEY